MTQDAQTPSTSGRRWLRVALLVSLVLNLLFVGLFLGAAAGKDRTARKFAPSDDRVLLQLGPYARALPDERRKTLAGSLRLDPNEARKVRRELRNGFQEFLTLLEAETLDVDALSLLIDAQQDLVTGRAAVNKQALLDVLSSMTAAERSAYAKELQKVLRRGPSSDRLKGEEGSRKGKGFAPE